MIDLLDKMEKDYFKHRFNPNKNRDKMWKVISRYLQKYIPENSVILDLGAGYCNFINNINGREKHALDIYPGVKGNANENVNVHISNCTEMNILIDNYFDIIFASNLFEHLNEEDFKKTLLEVKRILKESGRLIIIQPNFRYAYKEYFDDYTHKTIFTDTGLCDMLKSMNFKIIKCIPKFIPFSIKSRLPKSSLLLKLYLNSPIKPLAKQMLIIAESI